MVSKDAYQYWLRYERLAPKDSLVLLKTGIRQSTLATWKKKKMFPRADDAYLIAGAINTTVEYLVTGRDIYSSDTAREISSIIKHLTEDGLQILKCVASDLLTLKYDKRLHTIT